MLVSRISSVLSFFLTPGITAIFVALRFLNFKYKSKNNMVTVNLQQQENSASHREGK